MASAILRFRIDGGALQSSSVSDTPANLAGKSVTLVAASYAGWQTARWMIPEYPDGFGCPDGWSTDSGGVYYYIADPITGITPPIFALPSSGDVNSGQWGKFEFRLLVNGKVYSTKIGVEILSPNGVHDLAFGEEDEFGGAQRQWVEDQKTNLRTFDGALNGGAPVDAQYLLGTANGSLPSAVVWTTIGTTVGFASSATIPCSFTRTSSTTNAAIDTMKVASVCSSTAANGFGVATLYQAASKDVGRVKFIFTDITGSSEDSQFILQLRTAGAALADALLLSGTAMQVAALAGLGSGYVSVDNAGNLSVGAGGSGAPTDAPYLTVGPVSGLSAEVDITAIGTTVAFASSSVVPISTTRESSTTNTFVDVLLVSTTTSGTAEANYGPSALFKAEDAGGFNVDIGRAAFVWSNANSLSAASKFLIQLRLAGDGLATKLVLDGQGKLTVANLELTGLATGYLYSTSGVVSIGTTQPAPGDAPFLTVGPVSGLSAEVDVTAIGTTVAFASTTTEPIAIQRDDSDTNGIVQVCSLRRSTSGTAANNIGGRLGLEVENSAGAFPIAGYLSWRFTNATSGAEASELGWWTRTAGGALAKNMYLDGVGALTVVGSITGASFVGASLDRASAGVLTLGGTNATSISASTLQITNLANGSSAQHAAAFGQIATAVNAAVSGTTNTLAKFTGTNVAGNSGVTDDGTTVGTTERVVVSKDGIATTKTVAIAATNATVSGTQVSPQIGGCVAHSGGTVHSWGVQYEPQSASRSIWRFCYGTGAYPTNVPASTGFYCDTSDPSYGVCVTCNAFVSTGGTGFRCSAGGGGVKENGGTGQINFYGASTSIGTLLESALAVGDSDPNWDFYASAGTRTAGNFAIIRDGGGTVFAVSSATATRGQVSINGVPIGWNVRSISGNATAAIGDRMHVHGGGITITLPPVPSVVSTRMEDIVILEVDGTALGSPITIAADTGDLINGASTATLNVPFGGMTLCHDGDGTNWRIVSSHLL